MGLAAARWQKIVLSCGILDEGAIMHDSGNCFGKK
jgi:hypothetical protein